MQSIVQNLSFATPLALLALVVLPVWWMWRRRHRPPAIVFPRVSVLANGPRAGRAVAFLLFALRNLLLASAILGLARPRSAGRSEENTSQGINIVIVVDLSSSMLAQDFQPENRIEVAKDKNENRCKRERIRASPSSIAGHSGSRSLASSSSWRSPHGEARSPNEIVGASSGSAPTSHNL